MKGQPTLPWSAPVLVAGRYQVLRVLGTGGQATVYLARDLETEAWRAIKLAEPGADAEWHERFVRETRVLIRLSHPNVLRVHAVLTVAGSPGIVTEVAHGGSLAAWMRRNGSLPPARVVEIGLQCASALAYTHSQGVLHRDVKPANVLVLADGSVALADFGIAWCAGDASITDTGVVLGTVHFVPPELRAGMRPPEIRADVYSLGAMLHVLCTGRREPELFLCSTHPELLEDVPPALADLIERCCRFEAADRPADMDEVRERLADALASCPPAPAGAPELTDGITTLPGAPTSSERVTLDLLRSRLLAAEGAGLEDHDTEPYTDTGDDPAPVVATVDTGAIPVDPVARPRAQPAPERAAVGEVAAALVVAPPWRLGRPLWPVLVSVLLVLAGSVVGVRLVSQVADGATQHPPFVSSRSGTP